MRSVIGAEDELAQELVPLPPLRFRCLARGLPGRLALAPDTLPPLQEITTGTVVPGVAVARVSGR